MCESDYNIRILADDNKYTLIGQGNTSEILEYSDDVVLKLFREGFPFDAIEREWLSTTALQERFEDTPKALELVRYNGRFGILYERIFGNDMMNIALTQPLRQKEYGEILADIHLKMHEVNVPLPDTIHQKLSRDITAGIGLTDEEKQKVLAILESKPNKFFLCHFDFHPGNVMVTEDRYYVIDWMTCCSGDPAADVARFILLMTYGEPLYADSARRLLITAGMNKIRKSYLERYITESGIEREEIKSWLVPVAAARLSEMLTDHEREILVELIRENL
ncbi:MAG: phosphotransferase [Saccharofermentans sp.]|nr:phosphotransferase [Saccharofermentans sp.]